MRIIAGEFRRRLLETPPDDSVTRPIPDRVKESLFSILRGHFEGASVFDGFAGTGAIGLEAVSRGAARCVLVERDRDVSQMLRRNVESLGAQDRCEVVTGDCLGPGALARCPRPLHLAFLDPPYPLVQDRVGLRRVLAQLSALVGLLDDKGYAVLRTPWPLMLLPEGVEPAPAPTPERKRRPAKHDRRSRRHADTPRDRRDDPSDSDGRDGFGAAQNDEREDHDDHGVELTPAQIAAAMRHRSRASQDDHASPEDAGHSIDDAADDAQVPQTPKLNLVPADLTLPNARGPETHVYQSMAIHLYMRRAAT